MRWYQFVKLIYQIYGNKPDLKYIQSLGLLAIKIGQVHALRIDFLNEDTCQELSKLYRQADSLPAESIDKLLSSYVDSGWRDNFGSIEREPFASASVGQVHRGVLKNGDQVAIKIVKKDFVGDFRRDAERLLKFFRFILFFYPKLKKVADPIGIIEHIKEYTLEELDLRNEMKGQKVLKDIYEKNKGNYDLGHLKFLPYYPELSSEHVLVSKYLPEPTIDELLDKKTLKYDELLELFKIHGFFMFNIGTFHGDIHPGNIIIKNDDFIFIDNAALSHTGNRIRENLFLFFKHLSAYDYPACARSLNAMAEKGIGGEKYMDFEKKFGELYSDFKNATVTDVSLTRRMMETIKLGVNSGMVFEKGMFSIIKSLMYLDGMVLRCNPQAVLLKDMRQFISVMERSRSRNY